jgi:hypothetical protein
MSAHLNDGGPAFPATPAIDPNGGFIRPADVGCEGMSLRDYFAAQAILGLMTEPISSNQSLAQYLSAAEPGDADNKGARMARASYAMADAMLKARSA